MRGKVSRLYRPFNITRVCIICLHFLRYINFHNVNLNQFSLSEYGHSKCNMHEAITELSIKSALYKIVHHISICAVKNIPSVTK